MQAYHEVTHPMRCLKPCQILMLGSTRSAEVIDALRLQHNVVMGDLATPFSTQMRARFSTADIVLVDFTTLTAGSLKLLDQLNAQIGITNLWPRLLCFSSVHRNPHFELAIEKCGARYVRISDFAILLDAIDRVIAEMIELQRNGPCFQILHRFSQGTCAPGEEASACSLSAHGEFHQLPLAMVERLVFDFLAQHRRIALDSLQIVSGLSGEWFYRDHAANSGHKQIKRIRRASVKVLIQRIREAMASTFAKAGLRFDPYNVLRSCPAEGTNRILYRLHADVRWHHVGR